MVGKLLVENGLKVRASHLQGVAIIALVVLLYSEVIPSLVKEWLTRPAASHGLLVPPIAAYSAWLRRRAVLARPAIPDNRGLWLILGACLMLLVGTLGAEMLLSRLSLVVLLAGLLLTFWGRKRLRVLAFPLLLLVTMIPIPTLIFNVLSGPLQLLASYLATEIAQGLGLAVYREGNVIQLAGITLGVAEACSGLNSLSTLVVAAVLVSPLYPSRTVARIVLLLLAPPLAIAVNVLRVTGTAVLADTQPELALGFYHWFSGWAVFLAGFLILLGLAKILQLVFPRRPASTG